MSKIKCGMATNCGGYASKEGSRKGSGCSTPTKPESDGQGSQQSGNGGDIGIQKRRPIGWRKKKTKKTQKGEDHQYGSFFEEGIKEN